VVEGDEEDERQEIRTDERSSATERPRIAYAREAARALLRKHKIGELPVSVRRIAALEGLELRETPSLGEGIRARLVGDIIQVAGGDPELVKRFSIAHEIGHHHMGTVHNQGPQIEREANAFAGELLVPGPKLLEALRDTKDTYRLARLFQVSRQVIQIAAQQHKRGDQLT
jgi:hypothetical protein